MKIKAVLFDVGETLIRATPPAEVMRKILEAFEIKRSAEEIEEARKAVEKNANIEELPILGEDFWVKWNGQILEDLGIRNNTLFLAKKITELWWRYSEVELYPDAEKALELLKQKELKIGIITNGLKSDIDEILPKIGLKEFFDVEVASNTIGKMKPCKEVFQHALKKLNVLPYETLFVGDTVQYDYEGATQCGLKALLVDRKNNVKENVEKIESLTELLNHI
ncbi:MAG: HAD family hydrolase [Candidatus Bathyarchaeia archaeon]